MLRIHELTVKLFIQGRGEMAVLLTVTAGLLHHSAMDTWTECNVVSTGLRGNGGSACSYCSTVTLLCYGYMDLTVMVLVQGRGEIAFLLAVTTVL